MFDNRLTQWDQIIAATSIMMLMCLSPQNLRQGVFDVIPRDSLDGLTAEDLRLLLNGVGDINVQSLIGYTSFNDESGQYTSWPLAGHRVMQVYLTCEIKSSV